MSFKSVLSNIGRIAVSIIESIDEVYSRPTPCRRCLQEYPLYKLLSHSISDPYGVVDHRYYHYICSPCHRALRAIVEVKERQLLQSERIAKEVYVVNRHNTRAFQKGLPGTLKLNQWVKTLDFYQWKCAYGCGNSYEELDHWIPLNAGLPGTTKRNCIPSCLRCNRKKGATHPLSVCESSLSPAAHQRIQQEIQMIHRDQEENPLS